MNKAHVNGKLQDVLITSSFKNSEFDKLERELPYSVLEYLFVNNYNYSEIKKYLDNNVNIILNLKNPNNVSKSGELKVISKFKINGDTLENFLSKNKKDRVFQLDDTLSFDSKTLKRGNLPFYAIVTLTKGSNSNFNFDEEEIDPNTIFVNHIEFLEAISIDIEEYKALRKKYNSQEWLNLIFSTIGYNADTLTPFEKYSLLVRLIPFCIKKYHIMELGNKETAKSYFYSVMSDIVYSSSISAGSISIAQLVRNNTTHEPGILVKKNVVNFDEIPEARWKDNDIVTILQTYLQDGIANRDDGVIAGIASLVFTGNVNNFETLALKKESLFSHFKAPISNETIIDKLYFFTPGWKFTKINPNKYIETNAPRIRRDYFLCALNLLREEHREFSEVFKDTVRFANTESGRDMRVSATIAGLIMLLHPDVESMSTEELEAFAYIALTGRKILLRELEIKNKNEYQNVLEVQNSQINEKIEFDVLSNFIINTSETFLKSHDISIDNIDYYYLDYYKNYDITEQINTQYGFELIEPTIVIKCSNKPNVYKLAVSSYGLNMNVLEVHENKKKNNLSCRSLTENFMLIETNEIKENVKKLYVKKFAKSSLNTFKDLAEKYKDEPSLLDIIEVIVAENKKNSILSNNIRNLENIISMQSKQLIINQKKIKKLSIVSKIKDIMNSIAFSQLELLEELCNLRNMLMDRINEDWEDWDEDRVANDNDNYFLGKRIFRDIAGKYHYVYKSVSQERFMQVGKEYIKTKYQENLNLESKKLLFIKDNSSKDKAFDRNLMQYIDSIDNILDYVVGDKLNEFSLINYQSNSTNLKNQIERLNSHISSVKELIDSYEPIRKLLKDLMGRFGRINLNFSTNRTSSYSKLLDDLYHTIEEYNFSSYISNNQQTIDLISKNIDLSNLNENTFDKTIFDNNYITDIKKTSKN